MNIGLVTWFGTPNYGTNLQAYALYKALEDRGCNVKIIRRFKRPFSLRNIKNNFFYAHGIRRFWKYHHNRFPAKSRSIRNFCRTEMQIANVYTAGDLRKLLDSTDIFMAGSDQLWNCHDHFRGFEFLDFANGKKKISYATSIGTKEIPIDYRKKVKEYLSDFQHISIREQSGALSIANITERDDIATVLDPVLLQDKAFWERFSDSARQVLPEMTEEYVLFYILKKIPSASLMPRDDKDASLMSRDDKVAFPIPRDDGWKTVIIPSGENPNFNLPGATIVRDAGLREFVALVRGASLVVTDSFHGTALAIALERPFINLKRFSDSAVASQNIRLRDLLERLGIENNLPIDYKAVRPRLEALRAESNAYLDKALAD